MAIFVTEGQPGAVSLNKIFLNKTFDKVSPRHRLISIRAYGQTFAQSKDSGLAYRQKTQQNTSIGTFGALQFDGRMRTGMVTQPPAKSPAMMLTSTKAQKLTRCVREINVRRRFGSMEEQTKRYNLTVKYCCQYFTASVRGNRDDDLIRSTQTGHSVNVDNPGLCVCSLFAGEIHSVSHGGRHTVRHDHNGAVIQVQSYEYPQPSSMTDEGCGYSVMRGSGTVTQMKLYTFLLMDVRLCTFAENEQFARMRKPFGLFREMVGELNIHHGQTGGCDIMLCYFHICKAISCETKQSMCDANRKRVLHLFRLRTSGDAEAAAAGYAGVGIVLSERAEASLFNWIPVDSRLCAVRLATSVRESRETPTDCGSELPKDSFYGAVGALLQRAKTSDIVVVGGGVNLQLHQNPEPTSYVFGISALLVWSGVLRYVGFSYTNSILMRTIINSIPALLRFGVCSLILFFAFSLCGWVVLGPYNLKFRTFITTLECLYALINGDDMFVTFSVIGERAPWGIFLFSRLFLYVFITLFIYVVLNLFITIIFEAYEEVKPEDSWLIGQLATHVTVDTTDEAPRYDCQSPLFQQDDTRADRRRLHDCALGKWPSRDPEIATPSSPGTESNIKANRRYFPWRRRTQSCSQAVQTCPTEQIDTVKGPETHSSSPSFVSQRSSSSNHPEVHQSLLAQMQTLDVDEMGLVESRTLVSSPQLNTQTVFFEDGKHLRLVHREFFRSESQRTEDNASRFTVACRNTTVYRRNALLMRLLRILRPSQTEDSFVELINYNCQLNTVQNREVFVAQPPQSALFS
ncbi:mucolipin-3 [Clonorchis sinensis]|uniref:Mucolipin-3 n=1 Tax=Clonorchis sinensis TaxID=79923 RepID=G7YE98_CLOSI|nr:mucolipin-3 [Clonorchis sinensis]